MDTKETFVAAVLSKLPSITDERDLGVVTAGIAGMFAQGWSMDDSVSFNMCLEEVNPIEDFQNAFNAEEKTRLEKMEAIKKKYKK